MACNEHHQQMQLHRVCEVCGRGGLWVQYMYCIISGETCAYMLVLLLQDLLLTCDLAPVLLSGLLCAFHQVNRECVCQRQVLL